MKTKIRVILATVFIFVIAPQMSYAKNDSLQQVIDQADPGSTIVIKKGHYKENIVINKPIKLIAEKNVTIDGQKRGNVVVINADHVTISGFTIINSGAQKDDAGIFLSTSNNVIKNNHLKQVHVGVFIENGNKNKIEGNIIEGYQGHFSTRGNGIYLLKTKETEITNNKIKMIQDGVYSEDDSDILIEKNVVDDARYATHIMFSKAGRIQHNILQNSLNGLMVMGAEDFDISKNVIKENIHYIGYGALIYDSENVSFQQNKVISNSTGISLERASKSIVQGNDFLGNHVGLDVKVKNKDNTINGNNFIGNVLQVKMIEPISTQSNYWDDYRSYDLNDDKIGEEYYQPSFLYGQLVDRYPEFQFYFESPSIKMWESIDHIIKSGTISIDEKPLINPIKLNNEQSTDREFPWDTFFTSVILLSCSLLILRRWRESK